MKNLFYNAKKGERFTPEVATLNGVEGAIWTNDDLSYGRWVEIGKKFFPAGTTSQEIIDKFEEKLK
ncbi:MAG: hypothetical protein WCF51_03845 [Nitrosomonadaceae bacterium]